MSRADVTARTLTDQYALGALPVDVDKVAGELGIIVARKPVDSDVTGMLLRRDGQTIIGLNQTLPAEAQRFALAHAIGHHQIHASRPLMLDVGNRYQHGRFASLPTDREEAEANRFAAALLVPEQVVRPMAAEADFRTAGQLVDLLAPRFQVSQMVMGCRLMALGIVMDH